MVTWVVETRDVNLLDSLSHFYIDLAFYLLTSWSSSRVHGRTGDVALNVNPSGDEEPVGNVFPPRPSAIIFKVAIVVGHVLVCSVSSPDYFERINLLQFLRIKKSL